MTVFVVAALALVAPPQVDDAGAPDSAAKAHELRAAVRSALSAEARAPDRDARLLAVADVVRVYDRLKTNPNIAYRDKVRLRTKLRSRLNKVAADLKSEAAKSPNDTEPTVNSVAANVAGAGGGQGVADPGEALIELIESTIRPDSWRDAGGRGAIVAHGPRGRAAGAGAAGGAGGFGGGIHGGGGGGAAVQAEALIELIENTVRPETWEVNGGRGTIMYWPGS
jgi:hypothetical protein